MRSFGLLLLFGGALLVGLGGFLVYRSILSIPTMSTGQRGGLVLCVTLALLFGLPAIIQGWWMTFKGRHHWKLLRALQIIAIVLILAGALVLTIKV